jgi:hypothetical protein
MLGSKKFFCAHPSACWTPHVHAAVSAWGADPASSAATACGSAAAAAEDRSMALVIVIPFLVCIVGALVYGFAQGKASALGLWMFACGLLVTLLSLGHASVRLP